MSEEKKNTEHMKVFAKEQGFSLCGVADITSAREEFYIDKDIAERFDRALVFAKRIIDPVIEEIKDRPTALYFHHYRQLNFFLDRGALITASYIQEQGFQALPIAASQVIDWERHLGHVSHRKMGVLAGLGWMGRNNLLVSPELGARMRLVTVLTDMPLEASEPLKDDCGVCRRCLKTCPAEAIKEKLEDFDYMACYEKLREFRKSGIVGQHICGVCVKACFANKD
jgi:epoxyqueuosine reductase QueG